MKRLSLIAVTVVVSLVTAASSVGSAVAATFVKVNIATPTTLSRSKTFNVEFTALSTNAGDNLDVALFQNGSQINSRTTTKPFGDSGTFAVTVPADGNYQYYFTANNGSTTVSSATKTVTVDTAASAPLAYGGTTRNGNSYTVSFTVPAGSDITQVRVFSSAAPNFTADGSTEVGVINVTPGQTVTFTYNSPDNRQRFTAVQAFDAAGNGSTLTGDANTNVNQGLGLPAGGVLLAAAGAAAVAGAANDDQDGQVNADGNSTTDGVRQSDGDVLGTEAASTVASGNSNSSTIAYLIIAALILAAIIYANRQRLGRMFKRSEK